MIKYIFTKYLNSFLVSLLTVLIILIFFTFGRIYQARKDLKNLKYYESELLECKDALIEIAGGR